ncbi:hypothetical protein EGW08_001169, partial [Elysia chlorotica]
MLSQAAAILAGVLAVHWYFDDSVSSLDTLKGKRVLVTGASTGIGEQIAYQFAKYGSQVTVTARSKAALHEVARKCTVLSPSNETHHVVVADMKSMNKTNTVIRKAIEKMSGLDVIVLNHILPHPIGEFSGSEQDLELLQELLNVNFRSYVHLASHALPYLSESKGRIVVINSAVGKVSHPLLSSYAATKHALDGFFSSLRSQFKYSDKEVGITSCFLGYVGTESAVRGMEQAGQSRLQRWIKPAPPADTAHAIVLATALGREELYYPWWDVRPMVLLHSVWPGLADSIMRFMASPEGPA